MKTWETQAGDVFRLLYRRKYMAGRITIQDIADALGLSRNTVSKAINNTGVLAEATREKVLKKAVEMGYKQFSYININDSVHPTISLDNNETASPAPGGSIALLTTSFLGNSHFSSTMLDKIHSELAHAGYTFAVHRITEEDLKARCLPQSFSPEGIQGIMCIEVFDLGYAQYLTSLDIPVLFVDGPVPKDGKKLNADLLIMDNRTEIYAFVMEMKRRGKTTFGYIGDSMHCISFWERYQAMQEALRLCNLPFDEKYSIPLIDPDFVISSTEKYHAYLSKKLDQLPALPEVIICSNDFVAIDLLQVCRQKGLKTPDDFYLCGFDDSPESKLITPTLTTIHIHSQIMGYSAAQLLLSRISNPSMNNRTVYTETSLIYRESTED